MLGLPTGKGVMSIAGMMVVSLKGGGPGLLPMGATHWALMVVPWGMEAMRVRDSGRGGSVFC